MNVKLQTGILAAVALILGGCTISAPYIRQTPGTPAAAYDTATVAQRIYLIADTGEPQVDGPEPNFLPLARDAALMPRKSMILFIGDNLYPSGLPEETNTQRRLMERRLMVQVDMLKECGARGIFIPGNHDWDRWSDDGLAAIRRQDQFLAAHGVPLLPSDGNPGPLAIDCAPSLRLILFDSQWWFHGGPKPFYPGMTLEQTKDKFFDSLQTLIAGAGKRMVLVAAHHPLESHGPHGGFFDWKSHLFPLRVHSHNLWIPLPVLGSVYVFARTHGMTSVDFSSGEYQEFVRRLSDIFRRRPVMLYASGHEHSTQVIDIPGVVRQAICGFGAISHRNEEGALTTGDHTLFAALDPGYMRVDVLDDGRAFLAVFLTTETGTASCLYTLQLK